MGDYSSSKNDVISSVTPLLPCSSSLSFHTLLPCVFSFVPWSFHYCTCNILIFISISLALSCTLSQTNSFHFNYCFPVTFVSFCLSPSRACSVWKLLNVRYQMWPINPCAPHQESRSALLTSLRVPKPPLAQTHPHQLIIHRLL